MVRLLSEQIQHNILIEVWHFYRPSGGHTCVSPDEIHAVMCQIAINTASSCSLWTCGSILLLTVALISRSITVATVTGICMGGMYSKNVN